VTQVLIIANLLVYILQGTNREAVVSAFGLWPPGSGDPQGQFHLWQVVTYSFLHSGQLHLLLNMLALFMFGSEIERVWGAGRFLLYFIVCVISAALMQIVVSGLAPGPPHPTVGASGGIFGLLLAYGMLFPRRMVMLLFPPIPMPAWLLVVLYGAVELFFGISGTQAGVAHFAHLGGMAGGFLLTLYWRITLRTRR